MTTKYDPINLKFWENARTCLIHHAKFLLCNIWKVYFKHICSEYFFYFFKFYSIALLPLQFQVQTKSCTHQELWFVSKNSIYWRWFPTKIGTPFIILCSILGRVVACKPLQQLSHKCTTKGGNSQRDSVKCCINILGNESTSRGYKHFCTIILDDSNT